MPEGPSITVRTSSAQETEALGRTLGRLLGPGDVVALTGELGAGKTVLVRGIVSGAGSTAHVASPTFTLIREYVGPVLLFHADLYRLDSPVHLDDVGLDEILERGGVVLIEWAEHAGAVLPPEHLWISMTFGAGEDERALRFTARGPRYTEVLRRMALQGQDRR